MHPGAGAVLTATLPVAPSSSPAGFSLLDSLGHIGIIPDFIRPDLQGCQQLMHGNVVPSSVPHLELAFYFSPLSYFLMMRPSPHDMPPAADTLPEEPQAV